MSRRTISYSVESEKLRDALNRYAKTRGFKNASNLSRVAVFEYIRRRPWKDAPDVLHEAIGAKCDVIDHHEKKEFFKGGKCFNKSLE